MVWLQMCLKVHPDVLQSHFPQFQVHHDLIVVIVLFHPILQFDLCAHEAI